MLRRLGFVVTLVCVLGLSACNTCDLEILTTSLPDGYIDQSYRYALDATCDWDEWYLIGGTLPPGISLNADGVLSGIPTLAGSFIFTVEVVDLDYEDTIRESISAGFAITVHDNSSLP
jgi:hypothetical protein